MEACGGGRSPLNGQKGERSGEHAHEKTEVEGGGTLCWRRTPMESPTLLEAAAVALARDEDLENLRFVDGELTGFFWAKRWTCAGVRV